MKTRIGIMIFAATFLFAAIVASYAEGGDVSLRRFALVVGSNNGGPDRVKLRYATRDALSFVRVMKELGALSDADLVVLLDPKASDMMEGFRTLKGMIAAAPKVGRKEAVIYYSGHSDEDGLLFGEDRIGYSDIRSMISSMDVNVRVAILDSCSSGAFTRAKGVIKRPPFLMDSSSDTKGYAFLTSSADDEVAQESDKIEGSFFTHYLVSGLRGAADSTKDGLVTLNEAYSYAFRETLQRTEKTQYGAQHPKYDIQLTGTGDLVLTDLRVLSSGLILSEDLEGKFFVRDDSGNLVAEINKLAGSQVELGIEPGPYEITAEIKGKLFHTSVTIADKRRIVVSEDRMQRITGETTTARGDSVDEEKTEDTALRDEEIDIPFEDNAASEVTETEPLVFEPFYVSIVPFVSPYPSTGAYNFAIGLITSDALSIKGMQLSPIGNFSTLGVQGSQVSGIFNIAGEEVKGAQVSGVLNIAEKDLLGVQATGIGNFTTGDVLGAQGAGIVNFGGGTVRFAQGAGIVNIAGALYGAQGAGIGNILSSQSAGVQGAGIFNIANDFAGVQGSAIVNVANDLGGVQAGLINISRRVTGLQIGLVNISERFDAGFPIGLVNISSNGMFGFEAIYDDAGYVTGNFKSGSDSLYTLLTYSFLPDSSPYVWSYGAGLGINVPVGPLYVNVDAALNVIIDRTDAWTNPQFSDLLPKVTVSTGFKLSRFGVFGGVALGLGFPGMYKEQDPKQVYEIPLAKGGDPLYVVPHWFFGIRF